MAEFDLFRHRGQLQDGKFVGAVCDALLRVERALNAAGIIQICQRGFTTSETIAL